MGTTAVLQFPPLKKGPIETLQVNMGRLCNQSCAHCHMNAGPDRKEIMPERVVEDVLRFLKGNRIKTLDVTGGAPELHPLFRYFLNRARPFVDRLIVRSNLTVLFEKNMEDLPEAYRKERVELICSLPCYLEENVDRQRGNGVYKKSIKALTLLNAAGYAQEGSGLVLNLVYNPGGAILPREQSALERDYKKELLHRYGITFNRLFCLANMPIGRFEKYLREQKKHEGYINILQENFNASTLPHLMCLNQLSVRWDGELFDCDFNHAFDCKLEIPLKDAVAEDFEGKPVAIGYHCFGCSAGNGSSCGGSLV